jgi:protein-disulfide isomerase
MRFNIAIAALILAYAGTIPDPAAGATPSISGPNIIVPHRTATNVGSHADSIAPPATRARPPVTLYAEAKPSSRRAASKKPAPKPPLDEAAIGEAVRNYLSNNPGVLRGAILDLLRIDPEIGKLLAGTTAPPPVAAPAPPPPQQPLAADQDRIEEIVRNYLLRHPEVLQEAIAELEKRQALAEAERHKAAITANAELLFNSPRQVTLGNPNGDVTLVEFFDYNCAYCKRAVGDMLELMKADPKLKVVLKEFPVLGKGSVEAAEVSTAVRMQDKSGKKFLEFHQKLMMSRGQIDRARALAVAKEVGMDMARLEKDMASEEARAAIEESLKLAEALGLNGTPSYVVGQNVVIGAVGAAALRERVNTARCGKPSC